MTDEDNKDELGKQILETSLGTNYRYDNDGNVVTSYNVNNANIIFYMQSNGLWTTTPTNRAPYFANLKNYKTQTDTKHSEYNAKNLVDAKGEIIYYYRGDKNGNPQYTRTANGNEYVQDFSVGVSAEQLKSIQLRTQSTGTDTTTSSKNYQLMATVTGTNDTQTKWTDINFFIANGSTERKYRLEVWLGARDGSSNVDTTNHWVIYETLKYEALDDNIY